MTHDNGAYVKCDGLCKFKQYDEMCERCKLTDSHHHDDHGPAQYPADCRPCAAEYRIANAR